MADKDLSQRAFASNVELIKPKNGVFQVTPLTIANDYVAIAPIATRCEGSIIIPDAEPTIGIIVGVGPLVNSDMHKTFSIGTAVKFTPSPVLCQLDNLYPFYGSARIVLLRCHNILAKLPGIRVHLMEMGTIEDESGCIGEIANMERESA